MAVATGSLGRRGRREAADAAARERRSRKMLIGLSVVLAIVAVIEVPSMLSKSHSSPAATTTSPTAPATAAPGGATTASGVAPVALSAAVVHAKLALIDHEFANKDPFVAQVGQSSAPALANQPFATGPSVKASHFASKDPFKAQIGLVSADAAVPAVAPAPPVRQAPPRISTAAPTSGYIVVLRSLDTRSAGVRELLRAHANGFPSAELLFSSKYTTLRRGYWVVYVRYATARGATAGAARAQGTGYPSAYRRIAKP